MLSFGQMVDSRPRPTPTGHITTEKLDHSLPPLARRHPAHHILLRPDHGGLETYALGLE